MLTNELVIDFLATNKALTLKTLESEAGLGNGILHKVLKGNYRLNDEHLQRLLPVLKKYGFAEPSSTCRVFSFVNQKGGVAKTTSSAYFGTGLNKLGKRVLLVDFDPQMNLSATFGHDENEKDNIYKALKNDSAPPVINIREGLDLIPSDIELASGELEFYHAKHNLKLKNMLARLKPYYDFIIIDTGPSLGALMINSLVAADRVMVPVMPEKLAVRGLELLLETINEIAENSNPSLRIQGIFFTMVDMRLAMHKYYMEVIGTVFSHYNVYKSFIPTNTALKEAQHEEVDIFDYNPESKGAQGYMSLVKEVLGVSKKKEEING